MGDDEFLRYRSQVVLGQGAILLVIGIIMSVEINDGDEILINSFALIGKLIEFTQKFIKVFVTLHYEDVIYPFALFLHQGIGQGSDLFEPYAGFFLILFTDVVIEGICEYLLFL